ncbi:alpha/beta fold hydrolase [Rhodococcus sp. IEGM 1307]|uniref:alpha/beta fold hydrolase n=1 Tax=Rhodococcus sp. IEGM 1307 TaxID=3047091 RepID=UPI0024B84659|nr:alpha/beta fold hydrolase [Rhodococcus sp. IEGM 1307]MDI9977191.1 alpha/beta fold hydrolase [Rhodococcus sp. IEGM 1307]
MTVTTQPAHSAPHRSAPAAWLRRGELWVHTGAGAPRCASYVRWEAPGTDTGELPVVLVHGGGGQSLDWTTTPNGDPGWAPLLVEAGHPVYLPDRPAHGRSPYRPDIHGDLMAAATAADVQRLFAPGPHDSRHRAHTEWPWTRESGSPQFDALASAAQPLPRSLATGHRLDGDMLVALLERIGPSVVITHSAGAPAGWIATQRRPDLVAALVAVEPLGPPFRDLGDRGRLAHGLTAVPLDDRPRTHSVDPTRPQRLLGLASTPIAVVTADASGRHDDDLATVMFLQSAGARVEHLVLADLGLPGHGHGLIFERGHDHTLAIVRDWLSTSVTRSNPPAEGLS